MTPDDVTGIVIRRATMHDAGAIARVHVASWRVAYRGLLSEEFIASRDERQRTQYWAEGLARPDAAAFVAEADGSVFAFIFVASSRDADADRSTVGEVWAFHVLPQSWRRGVGTRLMAEATQFLAGCGYVELTLWVVEGNKRACAFYEASGFTLDGARQHDPELAIDELRYRRRLTLP